MMGILMGILMEILSGILMARATGPVLTRDKAEKQVILPTILNSAVRWGKLCIYTLQNPSDVF